MSSRPCWTTRRDARRHAQQAAHRLVEAAIRPPADRGEQRGHDAPRSRVEPQIDGDAERDRSAPKAAAAGRDAAQARSSTDRGSPAIGAGHRRGEEAVRRRRRRARRQRRARASTQRAEPQQDRALMRRASASRIASPRNGFSATAKRDRRTSAHCRKRDQRQEHRPSRRRAERGVDLLLGEEAEERRQPAHRERRRASAAAKVSGMARAQAAEPVTSRDARLVVDDAGDHEQRALEQRMRDQIEHRRLDRVVASRSRSA